MAGISKAERVARDLEKAAEVIEERGWCQNSFEEDDGSVCAIGAIRRGVAGVNDSFFYQSPLHLRRRAADAAYVLERALNSSVWKWNDRPRRRKTTVIRKLREAAAKVRAGEIQVTV